jgi:hypothetical protein
MLQGEESNSIEVYKNYFSESILASKKKSVYYLLTVENLLENIFALNAGN